MDDATSGVYSGFFVGEEGTWSSLRGVAETVKVQGLFDSLYTDRGSHYWHTPKAGGKVDKDNPTQFGRAMAELGIEMIAAYSPQARGRSERLFGTLQGRLPQELARGGDHRHGRGQRVPEGLLAAVQRGICGGGEGGEARVLPVAAADEGQAARHPLPEGDTGGWQRQLRDLQGQDAADPASVRTGTPTCEPRFRSTNTRTAAWPSSTTSGGSGATLRTAGCWTPSAARRWQREAVPPPPSARSARLGGRRYGKADTSCATATGHFICYRQWVSDQLDGPTFSIYGAAPEVCRLPEAEGFYIADAWQRVFHGVRDCADVGYAGAEHTWIVYADVWDSAPLDVVLATTRGEDCTGGRLGAGTLGLTMMSGWDIYGLTMPRFRQCGNRTGIDRWIGGSGHELGHALGLPHPPGCDAGLPTCDWEALMYLGYDDWPHTHLRDDEKAVLLASPFIR